MLVCYRDMYVCVRETDCDNFWSSCGLYLIENVFVRNYFTSLVLFQVVQQMRKVTMHKN